MTTSKHLFRQHRPHGLAADGRASRRLFLAHGAALGAVVGAAGTPLALNLLAASAASAQAATDYRALVCIFLFGGNDAYNTVLPTDAASWAPYSAIRNQAPDPIALLAPGTVAEAAAAAGSPARLGGVLPLNSSNAVDRALAVHPMLADVPRLFHTERRLAVLANVGPLIQPTTKAQYEQATYPRPPRLFSHNDQQSTWQALAPEGATQGWGGRMGDVLASMNTQTVFTAISASGGAVWLNGQGVRQYQVASSGPIRIGANTAGQVYGSTAVAEALNRMVGGHGGHVFEADLANLSQRAIAAEAHLRSSLRAASEAPFGTAPAAGAAYSNATDPLLLYPNPLTGVATANSLAQQLQVVARLVAAGQAGVTGVKRQVFFVSLGGFDTHDLQNRNHANLMAQLNQALVYFDATLGALGARQQVTTFTASDFGRTFTSNGDGTDHGWGAHHFLMGGAVHGGRVTARCRCWRPKTPTTTTLTAAPINWATARCCPAPAWSNWPAPWAAGWA